MKKSLFIMAISALSMQANAGFWDELGKAVNILNTVTGGTTTTTSSTSSSSSNNRYQSAPFAQITPAQEQQITQLVQPNTTDNAVNQAIREAKSNIEGVLKLGSCQNGGSRGFLAGQYQSPSVYSTLMVYPMKSFEYHPTNQCLNVTSLGSYKLKSMNELEFSVTYASPVSPEAKNGDITMIRENNGQWYVRKHMIY